MRAWQAVLTKHLNEKAEAIENANEQNDIDNDIADHKDTNFIS